MSDGLRSRIDALALREISSHAFAQIVSPLSPLRHMFPLHLIWDRATRRRWLLFFEQQHVVSLRSSTGWSYVCLGYSDISQHFGITWGTIMLNIRAYCFFAFQLVFFSVHIVFKYTGVY